MDKVIEIARLVGIPATIILGIAILYIITSIIGCILDFKGKIWPEIINWRRWRRRKREEKEKQAKLLEQLAEKLESFAKHCSPDNIAKRNEWMGDVNTDRTWMHQRADVYDQSIIDIQNTLIEVAAQLQANTKMTEDMFVESSRDRIIDFAEKASDYRCILSHEQFRRIFRVHAEYEAFLQAHNRTNGEVDTAYEMIQDGLKYRMKNHCFAEDIKGYNKPTTQND